MNTRIFINYRRDDSNWTSLAFYHELLKYFDKEYIFKDFNTIEPGGDFVSAIDNALEGCDVLFVIIGENWLSMVNDNGVPRVNDPNDYVRIEIATALNKGKKVIPVLIDNAKMPYDADLPKDIQPLLRRQAFAIDPQRFETDVHKLVESILGKQIDPITSNTSSKSVAGKSGNSVCECGVKLNAGDEFCPECGLPVTTLLNQYMKPKEQGYKGLGNEVSENKNDSTDNIKGNNVLGDLEVTGTKINAAAYNTSTVNTTQSNVYHQTVIDGSKQTVTCEVSGRKILETNSCQCPTCGRVVSKQCYLDDKLWCSQCEKDAKSKYSDFYTKIALDGGVIDASVREIIDEKAKELKLSEKQKSEIELLLRKNTKRRSSTNLSGMRQKEFDRLLQMIQSGEVGLDIALSKIEGIRKTTQDEDVAFWYFLVLAIVSPKRYNEELKSANIDIYWQHYWAFLSNLSNNLVDLAAANIDELKSKYEANSNDCALSESLLLLKCYIDTNDIAYWNDAKSNIKLMSTVESVQLRPIYLHLCAIVGLPSGEEQKGAFYTKTLLPLPKVNKPHSAPTPVASTAKPTATATSQLKGFVLDDSTGAPLVVEPERSPVKPKGNSSLGIIIAAAAFIVIAAIGYIFFLAPSGDEETVSQIVEVKTVEDTIVKSPQSTPDQSTTTTSTPDNTDNSAPAGNQTMAGKAKSSSDSSSSQAATLYSQAESAYNKGSYDEAIGLYTSAANLGSKDACVKLSNIYTTGVGNISANAMKAKIWNDKAVKLN